MNYIRLSSHTKLTILTWIKKLVKEAKLKKNLYMIKCAEHNTLFCYECDKELEMNVLIVSKTSCRSWNHYYHIECAKRKNIV